MGFSPAQQEGSHAWYWKYSQLPGVTEVLKLGEEPRIMPNYILNICHTHK